MLQNVLGDPIDHDSVTSLTILMHPVDHQPLVGSRPRPATTLVSGTPTFLHAVQMTCSGVGCVSILLHRTQERLAQRLSQDHPPCSIPLPPACDHTHPLALHTQNSDASRHPVQSALNLVAFCPRIPSRRTRAFALSPILGPTKSFPRGIMRLSHINGMIACNSEEDERRWVVGLARRSQQTKNSLRNSLASWTSHSPHPPPLNTVRPA